MTAWDPHELHQRCACGHPYHEHLPLPAIGCNRCRCAAFVLTTALAPVEEILPLPHERWCRCGHTQIAHLPLVEAGCNRCSCGKFVEAPGPVRPPWWGWPAQNPAPIPQAPSSRALARGQAPPPPRVGDPFAALGVRWPCSEVEIKQAFRDRVKEVHPDVGGTDEAFRTVKATYDAAVQLWKERTGR